MAILDYDGTMLVLEGYDTGWKMWIPQRMFIGPKKDQQAEQVLGQLRDHVKTRQYRIKEYKRTGG